MRSNHNLRGSNSVGVAGELRVSGMPLEWLDAGCWRLPSGKALAEFALQAGFLAPLLLRTERTAEDEASLGETVLAGGSKHFRKGEQR
jgi:hypothetical protein